MKKNKIKILAIIALIIASTCAYFIVISMQSTKARRDWKNAAIKEIHSLENDKKRILNQVSELNTDKKEDGCWVSDWFILLKNGEWLIYQSHCSKKAPHNISDIFIAKGSDGNWYYSTYHFCINMFELKHGDEQSENLKGFIKKYYLKTFDGKSDECLLKTWPKNNE